MRKVKGSVKVNKPPYELFKNIWDEDVYVTNMAWELNNGKCYWNKNTAVRVPPNQSIILTVGKYVEVPI